MSDLAIIRTLSSPLEPIPTGEEARLDSIPGIEAVLFDIYGTLLISGTGDVGSADTTGREEAMRAALEVAGYGMRGDYVPGEAVLSLKATIEFAHEQMKAKGAEYPEVDILKIWKATIRVLCQRQVLEASERADALRLLALQYESRSNPTWAMPGATALLARIRDRNLPLGIVSNAQFYTPLVIEAHLGASVEALGFDPACCVWSYERLRAKPSAEMFPPCLERLAQRGIKPESVLYVGNDMLNDVATAKGAGCKTALFAGDQRSLRLREGDPRVAGVEPDAVITSLAQLEEIL